MKYYQLRGEKNGVDTGELFETEDADLALDMFIRGGWWKLSWTLDSGKRVRLVMDKDYSLITITLVDDEIRKAMEEEIKK